MFDMKSLMTLKEQAMDTIERGDKPDIENLARNLDIFKDYYMKNIDAPDHAGPEGYKIISNLEGAIVGKRYF